MLENFWMWMTCILSLLISFYMFNILKIKFNRNFFMLFVYFQSLVYLNISPTMLINTIDFDLKYNYIFIQLTSHIFFQIPFILIYFINYNKSIKHRIKVPTISSKLNISILCLLIILITINFLYVVVSNNMIFTRIGHAAKASRFIELQSTSLNWVINSYFDKSILFLQGVLFFYVINNEKKVNINFPLITLIFSITCYGIFNLINSKLNFIIILMFYFGIYLISKRNIKLIKNRKQIIFLCLLIVYSFIVTNNFRASFSSQGFQISYFLPVSSGNAATEDMLSLFKRTNAVDLMARITENMDINNIALGKAWRNPIFLIFGPIINPRLTNQIKISMDTMAKNYLMRNYTDLLLPDYVTSRVTDAYGNFWIFGFLLAAYVFAKLCARAEKGLITNDSSSIVLGIFIISSILPFELELISILSKFIYSAPILIIIFIFNPIKSHENRIKSG